MYNRDQSRPDADNRYVYAKQAGKWLVSLESVSDRRQEVDLREWVSHMCRADILSILTAPPLCLSSGLTPSRNDTCNRILIKLPALPQGTNHQKVSTLLERLIADNLTDLDLVKTHTKLQTCNVMKLVVIWSTALPH